MKATFNVSSIMEFINSLGKIIANEMKFKRINFDEKKAAFYIMGDSTMVMFGIQTTAVKLTIGINPEVFDAIFPLLNATKTEDNQECPSRLALMVDRDLREIEFVSINSDKLPIGNICMVKPF